MTLLRWYRTPGLTAGKQHQLVKKLNNHLTQHGCELDVKAIESELCFYVELEKDADLFPEDEKKIQWILSVPFKEGCLKKESHFQEGYVMEIGPRLSFSTPFSTNAVSMCHSVGLTQIKRIEHSTRFIFPFDSSLIEKNLRLIQADLMDIQTQQHYVQPLQSFELSHKAEETYEVDVMTHGRAALEKANTDMGLAMDDWDLNYYTELFQGKIQRNPTNVECFDLAQSNSEHSRHWFFKGRMVIDGVEEADSLFTMVMNTQKHTNQNNVIKFNDNSSAIEGYTIKALYPEKQTEASSFDEKVTKRHIIFTAETHNFPTGVAPFPGATTGTGGRIRDVQATGRGAHVIAGSAGYCFGNLHIEGYGQPWEVDNVSLAPAGFANPLQIAIEASNGASDYGNKFGEPVLTGFARSFGMNFTEGRRDYAKPIMFSGGIGSMESCHVTKKQAETGMEVVKIGGPVYRIGVGGGAASSFGVQGDNDRTRDLNAVQRGDPEMEQKMNRIIRGCIERQGDNPILSIHDQGAGGNGNVLKEISEPAGAVIRVEDFQLGDPTLSVLEIWGAEYQETNAALVSKDDMDLLKKLSQREKCTVSFVGTITGDGTIKLVEKKEEDGDNSPNAKKAKKRHPVDLELDLVLGSMPRKEFKLDHKTKNLQALDLPEGLTVMQALDRVLRLPSLASKRYLTNKVDRSVTGLVAQQQCVGPLHTPLADVAVIALSMLPGAEGSKPVGAATSVGEQPIKGLVDAAVGARMAVAEALTNLVFAPITDLRDVKCSGNWMWPAKLPGEGALLYDACKAMCDVMAELGVAVDGGKDSLSMAARVNGETVKAPGTLVISTYVGCPDITSTVTPDLKCVNDTGVLLHVPLGPSDKYRLGGSALAQCFQQIGDDAADLDNPALFVRAFNAMQTALKGGLLLSGHDISDGGLITCIVEMAFAGNCGIDVNIQAEKATSIEALFNEELGWVVEVSPTNKDAVLNIFKEADVPCRVIGQCSGQGKEAKVVVRHHSVVVLDELMVDLRDIWEETSAQLERLQADPDCVEQEQRGMRDRRAPPYHLTFTPNPPRERTGLNTPAPKVAVIREEGSNGDREMVAAFHMAGFEAWDVTMQDLSSGSVTLDQFRGVAFVGGFSYADVMGSAKGWAATLRFNPGVREQFAGFYARNDTFSLGVCNGCQLMALLGWVGADEQSSPGVTSQGVHLDHNTSGRFESRFSTVTIQDSPALMLRGMEGSTMGIWVAHGEGRMVFKQPEIMNQLISKNLAPIRYVDDAGSVTTDYPFNPNGSPQGIAALCSPDGRHFALMPHPERCVLPWQWAWQPEAWKEKGSGSAAVVAPWMQMFHNAYDWCMETRE